MEGWENECKLAHGVLQCCSAAVLQCMTMIVLLGSLELLQHWWKILIGIMFPWISFNLTRCIDLQGLLSMKWVLKLLRLCLLHFCDLNTKYRGGHEMECTLGDAVKVCWNIGSVTHFVIFARYYWRNGPNESCTFKSQFAQYCGLKQRVEREVSFELATKTFVA